MRKFEAKNRATGNFVCTQTAASATDPSSKGKLVCVKAPAKQSVQAASRKQSKTSRNLVGARRCQGQGNCGATETIRANLDVTCGITAKSVEACLVATPSSILGEVSTTLRDQFTADHLLDLMGRVVNAYFTPGPGQLITIPVWSWTGLQPIPTREDLPKATVNVSSATYTPDQLVELAISLFGLLYYELETDGHFTVFSTDILNARVFPRGLDHYIRAAKTILQFLFTQSDTEDFALDETHRIALSIAISHANNLILIYEDPNQLDQLPALISSANHRYYNSVASSSSSRNGVMEIGNLFYWNYIFLTFVRPNLLGFESENVETIPKGLMHNQKELTKILQYEQEAIGRYFWVKWWVDPFNSQIFTFDGIDPDGYSRPDDWILDNFLTAGLFLNWNWLDQHTAPFKQLQISGSARPNALTYEDTPSQGLFGIRSLIELNAATPEIAQNIICESEQIWNKTIVPIYEKLRDLSVIRRAEAEDDFYSGAWRAKIKSVKKVNRTSDDPNDLTATAVSYVVAFDDTHDVTVPRDPAQNVAQAAAQAAGAGTTPAILRAFFVEVQAAIAEMDDWLERELKVIFSVDDGDLFNLLFKVDPDRGICGPPRSGTVPYASIDEILANYAAEQRIVGTPGNSLPELVFQSGFTVSQLLYEIREFIANQYVIENFAEFGFPDQASAGLCRSEESSYEVVKDFLVAQTNNGKSDIEALGRHYGFEADGVTRVPSEQQANGTLIYNFSNDFDYIYRQHYAVDTSRPLTPDNRFDPVTGLEFYQYTNPGDQARRAQFLATFQALETTTLGQAAAGKLGSYWRWKLDWMTQKMFGFVIQNADDLGILNAEFVEEYYAHTFVDTNGNACHGLQHTDPITILVRALGQLSGSANSSRLISVATQTYTIRVRFVSLDPRNSQSLQNALGTIIHEVALGHGFDGVPNVVDLFRGTSDQLSWLSNVNAFGGIPTEGFFYGYTNLGPGIATLFEGWATYGELVGIQKGLYVKFDDNGCPILGEVDRLSEFIAQVSLARVGGRQVVAIAENFSNWAWSVYKSAEVFKDLTDLRVSDSPDFHVRFISTPLQQTSYAVGLVTNVGILAIIREEAEARGCEIDQAAFNEFRITRTDYILGAPLQQVVNDNIDLFLTNCSP